MATKTDRLTDEQIKQIYFDGWLAGIAHGIRVVEGQCHKITKDVKAVNYYLTEQDWAKVLPEVKAMCDEMAKG